MHHAVGHGVHHVARAQQAQATHAHRTRGGAIAIEITDDQDALVAGDRRGQQFNRRLHPAQQLRCVQLAQLRLRLLRRTGTTRRVDPLQQGQRLRIPLPGVEHVAPDDLHGITHRPARRD